MNNIAQCLKAYTDRYPFDSGNGSQESVLAQLYQTYREAHDFDTPEIKEAFREFDAFLEGMPLDENNKGFEIMCRLCLAYEQRAFTDGVLYGAHFMRELFKDGETG